MSVFVDTGILLRAVHRGDPQYPQIRAAIRSLVKQATPILTGLQHFAEFWNVCTRPAGARGGFGLPPEEAARRLRRIERGVKVTARPR
jgi:predicted nucleic acid-binding protein